MSFLIERALEHMERAISHNRLGHAYLVHASEEAILERFAESFLHSVLQKHLPEPEMDMFGEVPSTPAAISTLDELALHGVILLVQPESKSRRIRIDEVREMDASLHLSDYRYPVKAAIIRHADRMQPQAENAFLKTLEEPPDRCLILLLSTQPDQLLPTIHSRCIHVSLRGDSSVPVLDAEEHKIVEALAGYYRTGKPGVPRALALMQQMSALLSGMKEAIKKRHEKELTAESAAYQKTTDGAWLGRREEYYNALTESRYLARREKFLAVLLLWFGDALRQQQGDVRLDLESARADIAKVARLYSTVELLKRYQAVERLHQDMQTNVHEALAMEVAFLRAFA